MRVRGRRDLLLARTREIASAGSPALLTGFGYTARYGMIASRFGGFEYTYIPFAHGWKQAEKDTQIPCLGIGQEGRTILCDLPTPQREYW